MTRREAIRRAAAAGAAPLVAAAPARAITLDELRKIERRVVGQAVLAEQTAAVAFEAIANGGLLDDRTTATMRILLDHAGQHADLMEKTFKKTFGDEPPLAPRRDAIRGLTALRDQHDALVFAARTLEHAIAAHVAAAKMTHHAEMLKLIAAVVGSDGQGLVLLRQLLGRPPVASAFERGRA